MTVDAVSEFCTSIRDISSIGSSRTSRVLLKVGWFKIVVVEFKWGGKSVKATAGRCEKRLLKRHDVHVALRDKCEKDIP
jgi:hypothetical protein